MVTFNYPPEVFPVPYQMIFIIAMIAIVAVIYFSYRFSNSEKGFEQKGAAPGSGWGGKIERVLKRVGIRKKAKEPVVEKKPAEEPAYYSVK